MLIKQDPVTKLWCREDGAVLMPPVKRSNFKKFRWTFGSKRSDGYCQIIYKGKRYRVHQIVCRAFHGLPPADKPFVDHISRVKSENFASNLRWTDSKGNNDNRDYVDQALEKYGVRQCEDLKGYGEAFRAEKKAQGLSKRKGPDGKFHWLPRIRP